MSPYFAYESSIPQRVGGQYVLDRAPIGHLIINFRVKLHVSSSQIPLTLDPNEVEAAVWMEKGNMEKLFSRLEPDLIVHGILSTDLMPEQFQLREFFPYFPNEKMQGTSKSSVLALRYLWLQNLNMFQMRRPRL